MGVEVSAVERAWCCYCECHGLCWDKTGVDMLFKIE